jgi:hypothetical protein
LGAWSACAGSSAIAISGPSHRCRRAAEASQTYHDKLVAMIHDEEAALLEHLGSVVHDLKRRIRVRKARHQW